MIVLDTHALVWWVTGAKTQLSKAALKLIDAELKSGEIIVSSISAWEMSMLIERGRLALSKDVAEWLALVGQIEGLRFAPVDNDIGVASTRLPGDFHNDPADRIIVATARKFSAALVTADEKIRAYPHVKTVW